MYWPRCQLTVDEAKHWTVYSDPKKLQKPLLYRTYSGELKISQSNTEDIESIQISRRSRVFAMTASGDVNNVEVQIYDSVGEQYTMGYVPLSNLLLGSVPDFRSMFVPGIGASFSNSATIPGFVNGKTAGAMSQAPFVFEPNIVLDPNQNLSFKGRCQHLLTTGSTVDAPTVASYAQTATVSFTLHVWEFPIE